MGSIDSFDELRKQLPKGQVLAPGSDEFEESLKRWSETCNKPAVSTSPSTVFAPHTFLTHF